MSTPDFESCITVLAGLWPRKVEDLTDEQVDTWRRCLSTFTTAAVVVQLRAWAESSRFFPAPSEIRERLQAKRTTQGNSKVKQQSRYDFYRARWAKDDPADALAIRNMSEEAVDKEIAFYEFRRSAEVYGPVSGETVQAWSKWQRLVGPGKLSNFEADPTGKANAIAIHDRYMGKCFEEAA